MAQGSDIGAEGSSPNAQRDQTRGTVMITALAGGVGAAKLLQGIVQIFPQEELTVIVNTADDIELHGLRISPDIDILAYTLAGIVDESKGWGIRHDTFSCLQGLKEYGRDAWFALGDRDLATHIRRTELLRQGKTLTEATREIAAHLGIYVNLLPMTDDEVTTMIDTAEGTIHFQEYLVKMRAEPEIRGISFRGIEEARPSPGVLESIGRSEGVIICPSNPIVSIGPILSVRGIRKALAAGKSKVVAISPIVGGLPIKGPADKMMRFLGVEVSALGVARLYADVASRMIIDEVDENLSGQIESLGMKATVTNTVMKTMIDKIELSKVVLSLLGIGRRR